LTAHPEAIEWDVVVAGTGIGGATLGHALAKAGRRVLFVERGRDLRAGGAIRGRFAEAGEDSRGLPESEKLHRIAAGGRATDVVEDRTGSQAVPFTPYVGSGTGGSSALYGMVMERFLREDFAEWPVGFDEMRPWYAEAERLYRVRGETDPLRPGEGEELLPPRPLSRAGAEIAGVLRGRGMNPYRLHLACEEKDGCRSCQGYLCDRECKNDAAAVCLVPALQAHGAELLTDCTAVSFAADGRRVASLQCVWRGERLVLRAKLFVLAAGAMLTPVLLQQSGLANELGQVGRNLMRHSIDLYVLTRAPRLEENEPAKEIGFSDFCGEKGGRFGSVQSFGTAGPLDYLRSRPGVNVWRLLGPLGRPMWNAFARQPILATILEDRPCAENRVWSEGLGPDGSVRLAMRYRLSEDDLRRREEFRRLASEALAPFRPIRARGTSDRPALGHVCGTCRFGNDSRTSVLDRWNRAHGVDNLYVADASFFPTSGGMNPALTIAANALRAADHLLR